VCTRVLFHFLSFLMSAFLRIKLIYILRRSDEHLAAAGAKSYAEFALFNIFLNLAAEIIVALYIIFL